MRRGSFALLGLVATWGCQGNAVGDSPVDAAEDRGVIVPDASGDALLVDLGTGSDVGDAVVTKGCPAGRGPAMAKIDVAGGKPYCIDTTEVTNAHLNVFLKDGTLPYDTHPACASVKVSSRPVPNNTPAAQAMPAIAVNYCYALAFCRWAGKRLCGSIGGGHASADPTDSTNEWFHACSNGLDVSKYPYGDTFDPTACNTGKSASLVDVQSMTKCHGTSGGHALVFDMSGNAGELDDYASDHFNTDASAVRVSAHGGYAGVDDPTNKSKCGHYEQFGVTTQFDSVGFRCCADYVP